ncbi:DUF2339 domain-containing protein [Chryseobacterium sp. CT-SW4]|uniref:DUF2339 domain-containing protein n=1 Tax=Chryseobacterium sp. SW-1 TaxID=3157343 RepID=UPI003B01E938
MTYSFFIILLISIIIFTVYQLSNRVKKLENEVSDLKQKIADSKSVPLIEKDESVIPQTPRLQSDEVPTVLKEKTTVIPSETKIITPEHNRLAPVTQFIQQNILTIIGIFTLVLGIGYFLKYAIDKNWIGETTRVFIGISLGALIAVTGHFLRKNYPVFSSIITGGGISILYLSATIAFREYHLLSQNTAFIFVCLITLISIALSYYYKSEILIIFSLIGGFLAPLMISTGQSNYPFLFTYLMVLNAGMLIIAFLKQWKSIGWIAFLFTYIYLFYWTFNKTEILNIYFYLISYVIFYAFALQDYIKKNTFSAMSILMIIGVNLLSIIGLTYIFNKLQYEPLALFPALFTILNVFLLLREQGKDNKGINYSVFASISVSLFTIAVALQFKTHLITTVWAVEATLLLFIWKKTQTDIFKKCFNILFPLVIIAQIITWSGYITSDTLAVILNPVFLTSIITIITVLINLYLIKQSSEERRSEGNFLENIFILSSYGIIYAALLFEIIYHISEKPFAVILCIGFLFSIYYIGILILLKKKLNIHPEMATGLTYLFLLLLIAHILGSGMIMAIIKNQISPKFYYTYLLYIIPFLLVYREILLEKTVFLKTKAAHWASYLTLVIIVSVEFYHVYILINKPEIPDLYSYQNHFNILYLPIIWCIMASLYIYAGLKKNIPELSKIGFVLIGIMILKLYVYDVWQMDNISRIIAFTLLGVILLLSSFLFQRLKNIIRKMVDNKEEKVTSEAAEPEQNTLK